MTNDENNPFNILGADTFNPGTEVAEEAAGQELDLNDRIKGIIGSSSLVLFMKGNPQMPQCGFSANTISMLNTLDVEYKTFDILSDMDIREGVKVFSNWPTYPQLYVNGQLVGGNDIITEMFHSGELQSYISDNVKA